MRCTSTTSACWESAASSVVYCSFLSGETALQINHSLASFDSISFPIYPTFTSRTLAVVDWSPLERGLFDGRNPQDDLYHFLGNASFKLIL